MWLMARSSGQLGVVRRGAPVHALRGPFGTTRCTVLPLRPWLHWRRWCVCASRAPPPARPRAGPAGGHFLSDSAKFLRTPHSPERTRARAASGGTCAACAAGTYKEAAGSGGCSLCAAGTYSEARAATGEDTCESCATVKAHSSSLEGGASPAACLCLAGFQGTPEGQCERCTVGHYKVGVPHDLPLCHALRVQRPPVPSPLVASGRDGRDGRGAVQATLSNEACVPCPASSYAAGGAAVCTPCPPNSVSLEGSTSLEQCSYYVSRPPSAARRTAAIRRGGAALGGSEWQA